MKPLNTIIIITYNQEDLISRSLDSIICQREFVYEIIVSDDCSTDKTWEVILEYQKKYPNIIRPFRNSTNLGIFGNIEGTWSKVSGDVIWFLAGDDTYCNGLFEEANKLIEKHKIDFINEAITMYFDYKTISPSGKEIIFRNNLIEHFNPISLKIRQLICTRTTGFSRKVLEKFHPVRKDIGLAADGLMDIQIQIYSNKNYYAPFIGSCYYSSIGISVQTNADSSLKSYILSLKQLKKDIKDLSKDDKQWLDYLQRQLLYKNAPSLQNYLSYFKYFILIIRKYYGWLFFKREIKTILKDTIKLLIPGIETQG